MFLFKSIAPTFVDSGMPYQRIFVEYFAALLGAMTIKCVWKLDCGKNKKIRNDQFKFATKNIKAKCNACELSVKRIVTFGVVLYHNQ